MNRVASRHWALVTAIGAILGVFLGLRFLPGVPADPASAHATVVSTTPDNGAELDTAPTQIEIVFDEAVTFNGLQDPTSVIDEAGERIDVEVGVLDETRTVLTIPLPEDIPKGAYIASWRVVSADTHPVGGSLQFGYGVPASIVSAPEPPAPSAVLTLAVGLVKGLVYLGFVLSFGLIPISALLTVGGNEKKRVIAITRAGIILAIIASGAQAFVQFVWIRSATASDTRGAMWPDLLLFTSTPYAIAVGVRIVILSLALSTAGTSTRRTIAHTVLGITAVGTIVANGHGGAGSILLFASTSAHAISAIGWIGGLVVLGWFLLGHRLREERLRLLPRWSLFAMSCVGVLAISGLVQSFDAVQFPSALFETTYGIILLAKLLLVAAALFFGARGFLWIRGQQRLSRPLPGQTARLRARIRWETAVTVLIVAVSGVLSSITPAKDDWAPVASSTTTIGPYDVQISVGPARLGPQSLRVTVVAQEKTTSQPEQLIVALSEDEGTVAGLEVPFPYRIPQPLDPGVATTMTFVSAAVNVPTRGTWDVVITLVVDRMHQYSGTVSYEVH